MTTEQNPKIMEYLQSVKEHVSPKELEGYLHVNHIIHAFTKGEEHGESKFFEKMKDEFVNNISQHFLYSANMVQTLSEKKFQIDSCWISPFSQKTIFVTTVENTISDEFINLFYDLAFDFEGRYFKDKKSHIQFSFIGNENIDADQLACDNYIKVNNNNG